MTDVLINWIKGISSAKGIYNKSSFVHFKIIQFTWQLYLNKAEKNRKLWLPSLARRSKFCVVKNVLAQFPVLDY